MKLKIFYLVKFTYHPTYNKNGSDKTVQKTIQLTNNVPMQIIYVYIIHITYSRH